MKLVRWLAQGITIGLILFPQSVLASDCLPPDLPDCTQVKILYRLQDCDNNGNCDPWGEPVLLEKLQDYWSWPADPDYYPIFTEFWFYWPKNGSDLLIRQPKPSKCPGAIPKPRGISSEYFLVTQLLPKRTHFEIVDVFYDDGTGNFISACNPPEPPCPDLNIHVTGSVLPVRRGVVRVDADWCK